MLSERGNIMNFVLAGKEDCEVILGLYQSAIGTEGCTWSEHYPTREHMEGDRERESLFCLKNDVGEIVGAISIDLDEAVEALTCWDRALAPMAELSRLVVKENYQNQGIARLLLQNAMAELKNRGYKSVHFLVSKTNYKALNSYAKLSFERKGECDLYEGQWWCYEQKL